MYLAINYALLSDAHAQIIINWAYLSPHGGDFTSRIYVASTIAWELKGECLAAILSY